MIGTKNTALGVILAACLGWGPSPANAAICQSSPDGITAVHTCVDRNGGDLCEGDWVDCTVAVAATTDQSRLRISVPIPGSFFSLWNLTGTIPPGSVNSSQREGVPLTTAQLGQYVVSNITLTGGGRWDFTYEAQVRDDTCFALGEQTCRQASFRFVTLNQCESTVACTTYDCSPPGPLLTLTKTYTGPATVVPGTPVSWEIELSNVGTAPDTGVRVTDIGQLLPAKLTAPMVTYSRPPSINNSAGHDIDVTWNSVAPGETIRITIEATYINCAPGSLDPVCNKATVTSANACAGGIETEQACVVANPSGSSSLDSATKEMVNLDGPALDVGDRVHITVTLTNAGICPLFNGQLEDQIPSQLTYTTGSAVTTPATGTPVFNMPSNTINLNNFTVPASPTPLVFEFDTTVNTVPGGGGSICNTAGWRFGITGYTPTNTVCLGRQDMLAAQKAHSDPNRNNTVGRGQTFDYVITVTNTGATSISDAMVTDTVPPCFDVTNVVSSGGGTINTVGRTVTVSNFNVNASPAPATTITITVRENGTCTPTPFCNTAVVTSPGLPAALRPQACISITEAGVVPTKAHSDPHADNTLFRGETFDYFLEVTNGLPTAISDLSIRDVVPSCFDVISVAGPGTPTVMGQQVDIVGINLSASPAPPVVVTITVQENGSCPVGDIPCNNYEIDSSTLGSPITSNDACIELVDAILLPVKSHSDPNLDNTIRRGQSLEYYLEITNGTLSNLTDVSVVDMVPSCFDIVSVSGPGMAMVVGQRVDITAIPVDASPAPPAVIIITVQENGSCVADAQPCNSFEIDSGALANPIESNSACIRVVDGACVVLPASIPELKAVKNSVDRSLVDFSWLMDPDALDGYGVRSVDMKTLLPPAGATLECSTLMPTALVCPMVSTATMGRIRFFEVAGVCGGTEGAYR